MKKKTLAMAVITILVGALCSAEIKKEEIFNYSKNTPETYYYDTDDYGQPDYEVYFVEFVKSYNEPRITWNGYTYEYAETMNMGKLSLDPNNIRDARFMEYKYIMLDVEERSCVIEAFLCENGKTIFRLWKYKGEIEK